MRSDFDLAIIGSGFSGSLLAMIAQRAGRSVMLLDRGVHPRFAIGESTSPLLNLVIRQVADRYDLPRLVVDAGGPRGFLSRALGLGEKRFGDFPATQALYSHFIGVHRCDSMPDYEVAGASPNPPVAPFPMDDAAVHHVFDGGWMWALRFNNGVTSAGVVVTDEMAKELGLSEGEAAWRRFLSRFPSIAAQFADAR